jgi:hypothetical protein
MPHQFRLLHVSEPGKLDERKGPLPSGLGMPLGEDRLQYVVGVCGGGVDVVQDVADGAADSLRQV